MNKLVTKVLGGLGTYLNATLVKNRYSTIPIKTKVIIFSNIIEFIPVHLLQLNWRIIIVVSNPIIKKTIRIIDKYLTDLLWSITTSLGLEYFDIKISITLFPVIIFFISVCVFLSKVSRAFSTFFFT